MSDPNQPYNVRTVRLGGSLAWVRGEFPNRATAQEARDRLAHIEPGHNHTVDPVTPALIRA